LDAANQVTKRAAAAKTLFIAMMRWNRARTLHRRLHAVITSAKLKEDEKNAANMEDDLWSYGGSSIGSAY
jgi:hypothetical protein